MPAPPAHQAATLAPSAREVLPVPPAHARQVVPVPPAHQTAPVEESTASAAGESGAESAQSSDPLQPAEPLARLGALLVDGLLVSMSAAAALIITLALTFIVAEWSPGLAIALLMLSYLLIAGCTLWYQVVFIGECGQTIGKRVLGVKVVDAATHEPIGNGRALLRLFVLGLLGTPCYLGYLTVFLDQMGQYRGWHDLAVKSRAVRVPRIPSSEALTLDR